MKQGKRIRVGLVSCAKRKHSRPMQAQDLYCSTLFIKRKTWVKMTCDRWFIMSAQHGLLAPELVLSPYDDNLYTAPRSRKREWAAKIVEEIKERLGPLDQYVFDLHASVSYTEFGLKAGLLEGGAEVENAAKSLIIGKKLSWYTAQIKNHRKGFVRR